MVPAWFTHNRLYDLARSGRRLPPWWGVIVVGILIGILSIVLALPVMLVQIMLHSESLYFDTWVTKVSPLVSGFWWSLNLTALFGAMILLVWLWIRFYEQRGIVTIGFELQRAWFLYGRGLLLGFAAFCAVIGLLAPFGLVAVEPSDPALVGWTALGGVLLVLIPGWLIQGAAEEVLTRGWMLPTLAARYRPWVGVVISSLFFAAMHGLNPNLSALALLNLFLYGLFAALYALREESLWGICAFHSIWNWIQGNFFGFQVSGQTVSGGMLFNLMETGPDWLTGGAFGPEGGFATTLVLVISMAIIWWWPATSRQPAGQPVTVDR